MKGSTEKKTIQKMVEVDEEVVEVTLTMREDQANILLVLVGRMGPTQVKNILIQNLPYGKYSVDETMAVVYDFYNVLWETVNGKKFI